MSDGGATHEVVWSPGALRALDALPLKVADAVIELVYGALAREPHRVGKELHFDLAGSWSARRGTFRVIYSIDDDAALIRIERVAQRADAYRPR